MQTNRRRPVDRWPRDLPAPSGLGELAVLALRWVPLLCRLPSQDEGVNQAARLHSVAKNKERQEADPRDTRSALDGRKV